jgi:DNA repair protein RecN (Recombination protein N)
VLDLLGEAVAALRGRAPLQPLAERLVALQADTADAASILRAVVEGWEDDPERLEVVRARRQLLRELSRKYGEGPGGVLAYGHEARRRLEELECAEEHAAQLSAELRHLDKALADEAAAVGAARRQAAPDLGRAVERHLRTLAMAKARLEVTVGGDDPGDDVTFLLGPNPGEPLLSLAKVASGGELARTMLALRLELTDGPPTMVFDEVDAGVGGEAALAVGRALAELAEAHQVLVVTHLAQVAAFAERQFVVHKEVAAGRTRASVTPVDGEARVVELARMLSGRPDSATARRHAEELLRTAR